MRCHKNDQPVLIMADKEKTKPYRFYRTDVYRCPGCAATVVTRFSKAIESYEESFEHEIEAAGDKLLRVF